MHELHTGQSAPTTELEPFQPNGGRPYPLFETMLQSKGLKLQATYTCQDIATLFGVTARTIQSKAKDGTLPSRKLIGGARFLPVDLENYLQSAGGARP